ncbi:multidrug transporter EmrE-like cation transporter [Allocatelliglobosispora scoriae]|uniref:Multidrug transporter EmrE-like cation transporter n=1 Tax=Allocatelliglobosispora scoriae TaxID=643052 RepID=A0A841BW91_9ACTN|nr:multidrug transporter EmrE-like cation transporter [Allocatelliglobosispora scoriae]
MQQTLDAGLLLRLLRHRTYLVGLGCQILGFFLALFARRDLPLFLVQASLAAGLGVTAVLGVLLLKWRLPKSEMFLLGILVLGIGSLAVAAQPAPSEPLELPAIIALIAMLGLIVGLGFFTARIQGTPGSVALGAVSGLGFACAAVAARPLANTHSVFEFVTSPLLYLVIVHSLTAQVFLGMAMQRGSTNAAVAAMDAAGAVPAAAIGLLLLGDQIRPGTEWLALVGFLATLGSIIALTRYAEPQTGATTERIDQLTARPGTVQTVPAMAAPARPAPPQHERPAWLTADTTAAFELITPRIANGGSHANGNGHHVIDQPTAEVPLLSDQTIEIPRVRGRA